MRVWRDHKTLLITSSYGGTTIQMALHGMCIIQTASKDLRDHIKALEMLSAGHLAHYSRTLRGCLYRQPLVLPEPAAGRTWQKVLVLPRTLPMVPIATSAAADHCMRSCKHAPPKFPCNSLPARWCSKTSSRATASVPGRRRTLRCQHFSARSSFEDCHLAPPQKQRTNRSAQVRHRVYSPLEDGSGPRVLLSQAWCLMASEAPSRLLHL